jgi:hypothetical protein
MKLNHWMGAAALGFAMTLSGPTALFAADAKTPQTTTAETIAPNQQIGLDAGPEHISGVFRPAQGGCALSVTMVESFVSENDPTGLPAERMQVTVEPGKPAVLDTEQGEQARFECLPGAQAMKATVYDQVAAVLTP